MSERLLLGDLGDRDLGDRDLGAGQLGDGAAPAWPAARPAVLAGPRSRIALTRLVVAWLTGVAGLVAYNWWVLVPLKPGLLRSPDEFFSNLEVSGHPYAALMQHADTLSGLLLLVAFVAIGRRSIPGGLGEWLGMLIFGAAGAVGGLFPQVCSDGISATCLSLEWQFNLSASQYVHDGAGIIEFAAITVALACAVRRTRGERTRLARRYRRLAVGAAVAYPFLLLAYVLDRLGSLTEAAFFVGFTVLVLTQLAERTRRDRHARLAQPPPDPSGRSGVSVAAIGSAGVSALRPARQRGKPQRGKP